MNEDRTGLARVVLPGDTATVGSWPQLMPRGHLLADPSVPLTAHTAFTEWQFAPVVTVGVAVLAVLYVVGIVRVRRRHPARPWPWLRSLAFFAGLAAIVVATESSIGAYDDVLFSVHMVQHLMLIMVAPAAAGRRPADHPAAARLPQPACTPGRSRSSARGSRLP